jgi:hypothetical protein
VYIGPTKVQESHTAIGFDSVRIAREESFNVRDMTKQEEEKKRRRRRKKRKKIGVSEERNV